MPRRAGRASRPRSRDTLSTCEAFHRVRMSDSPEEPARAITLALEEAQLSA